MDIRPETIGALIGAIILTIMTAQGFIKRNKRKTDEFPKTKVKEGEDNTDLAGNILEITQDYRDRLRASERRMQEYEAQSSNLLAEITDLKTSVHERNERIESLKVTIEELTTKITQLDTRIAELVNELSAKG